MTLEELKEQQEKEFEKEFTDQFWASTQQRNIIRNNSLTVFISKVRQQSIEWERERIGEMIKEMPDTFPELESDNYDKAYKDAKEYMLDKLKNLKT